MTAAAWATIIAAIPVACAALTGPLADLDALVQRGKERDARRQTRREGVVSPEVFPAVGARTRH